MSGYRKSIQVKATIDGAEHVFTLRPMTVDESIEIVDSSAGIEDKDAARQARGRKTRSMAHKAVLSVDPPVKDEAGADVSVEELFSAAYFVGALRSVANEWTLGSVPRDPT